MTIELTLSTEVEPVRAVIDYRVHHAGAGARAARVFKLVNKDDRAWHSGHSLPPPSVPAGLGAPHPPGGVHRVEVQVNGRVLGGVDVEVCADDTGAP